MNEHLDDKELLAQFKDPSSKEKGYTRIIKKYQEKLYWHIRRMLVDHEDTNDVLQQVLIKIWNGLENFREDSKLFTWMYRIATNETLTFIEKQKKQDSKFVIKPDHIKIWCSKCEKIKFMHKKRYYLEKKVFADICMK